MKAIREGFRKKIVIAEPKPEDAREIEELFYRTWLETYPNKEAGVTRDDVEDKYKSSFSDEMLAKRAERIAQPPDGDTLLLAKEGKKIVGLCRVVVHQDKNQLQAIYVLPEYQSRGVGSLLWKEAQKHFDVRRDIVVHVATYNTKAVAFYKKLGFEDTGLRFKEERFTMKSGATIPEMEMRIHVQPQDTKQNPKNGSM